MAAMIGSQGLGFAGEACLKNQGRHPTDTRVDHLCIRRFMNRPTSVGFMVFTLLRVTRMIKADKNARGLDHAQKAKIGGIR